LFIPASLIQGRPGGAGCGPPAPPRVGNLLDQVVETITANRDWRKKGLQMVVIGLGAAAIGFAIGHLFHAVS
jgi:hypothetical protein